MRKSNGLQPSASWLNCQAGRALRACIPRSAAERSRLSHRVVPEDAGSEQTCPDLPAVGSVHVTLESDDGSIAGEIDAPPLALSSWPDHDRELGIIARMFGSPAVTSSGSRGIIPATVQLRGNLQLSPDWRRTPDALTFTFIWYRIPQLSADRIGIGLSVWYREPTEPCVGACRHQSLAMAIPPDGCLPWELLSNGVCVKLEDHPEYGAPPAPVDAGVAAPPSVPVPQDAGTAPPDIPELPDAGD